MAALSLIFDIIGRDHASKALDKVSGSAEKTGGHLKGLGKVAAGALGGAALGGITAFTAGLVGGFKEAVSYQKITDQLAQTIKSTGGAAGVSVDGLKKYAGQLESMSGVDEELILSSQNVLATFTQIQNKTGKGNDIFNQASLAALNLSTTLGTDVNSAAIQVGKALNDPLKGITALSKAGVSFTAQQKEQIKTLVKSGNTLGAQKIILGELNKEFGGAAAAAGKGFGGTIARLKDTVSDAFRDIATRALPTLTKLADGLAKYLPGAIAIAAKGFGLLGRGLMLFAPLVRGIGKAISDFVSGIKGVGPATDGIFSTFRQLGLGVSALFAAMKDGDVTSDGLVGKFEQVGAFIKTSVIPVFKELVGFLQAHAKPILIGLAAVLGLWLAPITSVVVALGVLYAKSETFRNLIGTVASFIRARVVPAFVSIGDFLATQVFPALVKVGRFLVTTFTPTFRALGDFITNTVVPAFRGLADRIRDNQPLFQKIGLVIGVVAVVVGFLVAKIAGFLLPILVKLAGFLFRTLFAAVGVAIGIIGAFAKVIGALVGVVGSVIGFIAAHWKLLLGILTGPIGAAVVIITGHWGAIRSATAAAWNYVSSKISGVLGFLKNLFLNFTGPGLLIKHFDAIVAAVKSLPGRIASAASGMFDGIKNAFRSAINWIIDKWNGLSFSLPGVSVPGIGKIGGFTLSTPDIPRLRLGGRVSPNTPYIVGEVRPELFVSDRAGRMEPRVPASAGLTVHIENLNAAPGDVDIEPLHRRLRNLAFTMGV